MKKSLTIKLVLGYTDIFDDPPQPLDFYLKGVGKNTLLEILIMLIVFSDRKSKFQDSKELITMFFSEDNNNIANEIYGKVLNIQRNKGRGVILLSLESVLNLFEYVYDNISEEETQSKSEIELNIFKALLISNEDFIKRQDKAIETTEKFEKMEKLAPLTISSSLPYSDVINYDLVEVVVSQLVKSILFFEFLENNNTTKLLLKEFLTQMEVRNWKEYLIKLLPLVFSKTTHVESTQTIVVPKNNDFEKSCKFLDKLSISDSDVLQNFDFKNIRSNPIIKIGNGEYKVIYHLFMVELLHKGLYFKIAEINKGLQNSPIKQFRGYYCDEFSEKYLFYSILNYIFKGRYIVYSGEDLRDLRIVAEPDYYVRNGNKVFLFESKDVLLNAKDKHSFDYDIYEKELRKRFYKDGNQNKAVNQLVFSVKRILKNEFSFDTKYKSKNVRIFPIIVIHDRQLDVAGVNYKINEWFNDELQVLKSQNIDVSNVQPIVLIEINSLIVFQEIFKEKRFSFEQSLVKYYEYIKEKKFKDISESRDKLTRFIEPYSSFVSNHTRESGYFRAPKIIKEKGLLLFQPNTIL